MRAELAVSGGISQNGIFAPSSGAVPSSSVAGTIVEIPSQQGDESAEARALLRGDRAAFAEVYAAHYEALCRYALRLLRSRAAAEDLVHDVFLRLWRERERLAIRGSVRSYLYMAVRNRSLDVLRRARTEVAVIESSERLEAPSRESDGGIDAAVASADLAAALQRAIDELPPRVRETILLRWRRQLTNREIADALGVTLKTVEAHLARAYRALRESLPRSLREGL